MALLRKPLLALALASLGAASSGATSALALDDPRHDIVVSGSGFSAPVDSIDITRLGIVMGETGVEGASLDVVDLARRGIEDRLFVQSEHGARFFVATVIFADERGIIFASGLLDGHDPAGFATLVTPDSFELLDATASVDVPHDRVSWTLASPVGGEIVRTFGFTVLHGCDDEDSCQPSLLVAAPHDVVPNDAAGAGVVLAPQSWWSQFLPEEDGTLPRSPISLAAISDVRDPPPR